MAINSWSEVYSSKEKTQDPPSYIKFSGLCAARLYTNLRREKKDVARTFSIARRTTRTYRLLGYNS